MRKKAARAVVGLGLDDLLNIRELAIGLNGAAGGVAGNVAPFEFLAHVDILDRDVLLGRDRLRVRGLNFLHRVVERRTHFCRRELAVALVPESEAVLLQPRPAVCLVVDHDALVVELENDVLCRLLPDVGTKSQRERALAHIASEGAARVVSHKGKGHDPIAVRNSRGHGRGTQHFAQLRCRGLIDLDKEIDLRDGKDYWDFVRFSRRLSCRHPSLITALVPPVLKEKRTYCA